MSNESKDGQVKAANTKKEPVLLPVEEHAKRQRLTAPIFAAVMQSKGWASGKMVTKTEFEEAINAFLSSPMGGKN